MMPTRSCRAWGWPGLAQSLSMPPPAHRLAHVATLPHVWPGVGQDRSAAQPPHREPGACTWARLACATAGVASSPGAPRGQRWPRWHACSRADL